MGGSGYPATMPTRQPLTLSFSADLANPKSGKSLCDGLSAVLQIDGTLWVANDESATVECLTLGAGPARDHRQFQLSDYIDLPIPRRDNDTPEIDVEGMDLADGWLWITGSHSRKRSKPDEPEAEEAQKQLEEISLDANRYLLARVPVCRGADGLPTLVRKDGKRVAGMVKAGPHGNVITRALAKDKHLAAFMKIPGKENGFDIEGLAVSGDRVWLGLRGPVLAGWAIVLEVRVRPGGKHGLQLVQLPEGKKQRVRKHFLQLGGLGIRDLCFEGDDLLLLAGPTMSLDGPVRIFRWRGAAQCEGPCVVEAEALQPVLEVPSGKGCDQGEGMALLRTVKPGPPAGLLVVYDRAAPARRRGKNSLTVDIFDWPPD